MVIPPCEPGGDDYRLDSGCGVSSMHISRVAALFLGIGLMVLLWGGAVPGNGLADALPRSFQDIGGSDGDGEETYDDWLSYLNWYRSLSGLPALTEDESFNYGCTLHAIYMVKNNVLQREEDPANKWYTDEGSASGENSNVFVSNEVGDSFKIAIDQWMEGPFTAMGILDPELVRVGYGEHHEVNKTQYTQSAAALDVISGMDGSQGPGTIPVFWPGNGSTTPIGIYEQGRDLPDPLTSCPGYENLETTGAALLIQSGFGRANLPEVTASSIVNSKGENLEHCVFDEGTYSNPSTVYQDYGRAVLSFRDAIVIIPKYPLEQGETYSVSITINGETYSWSFKVSETAKVEP